MTRLREILFMTAFLLAITATAQDSTGLRISNHLKSLVSAPNDRYQDSLNELIKADLRILLNNDNGLKVDLRAIPITQVEAPDGAFRLVTWNLPRADGSNQFEGFLLARSNRGQVLTELRDMTPKIPSPEVPELGPDRWYGALYYEVIPVQKGGRTLYTLLGWKGYSRAETRKVIEILSFKNGKPRFGAPVFGTGKLRPMRKVFGYAYQASMTLRYDPMIEGIVLDHLSPSRADMKDQWAFYGPDMSHDGYFWHKGEWWFGPEIDLRDPGSTVKPFNAPRKPLSE